MNPYEAKIKKQRSPAGWESPRYYIGDSAISNIRRKF